ncbi:MAG TPA: cytochrome d ubiquinol oxidase subunit II [Gemmatimonadales bacterium]|nr:cytochrome d ubiquinol oxidase subunit II [Gemmatimonadales bacterium]
MSGESGAQLIAIVVMLALNAYAVLAGADFGGGVWDLFASGPHRERQRRLIADAIAPVWEANHVWIILVVVLLFTCFPPVFARFAIVLHIPVSLMLIGIVLRGSAFIFRSYERGDETQRRWGRLFAIASLITPLLLGAIVGAVASGQVTPPVAGAGFVANYVTPWATPFAFAVGVFALCLFGFLAAVYLTVEAKEPDLREDFRIRALASGVLVFLSAGTALLLSLRRSAAPLMGRGLTEATHALPLQVSVAAVAVTAMLALWFRRFGLARLAAAAQVSLILWGWALSQYPYLIPPDLTIQATAAPWVTIRLVLIALGLGAVVLVPSLWYLFRLFKSR